MLKCACLGFVITTLHFFFKIAVAKFPKILSINFHFRLSIHIFVSCSSVDWITSPSQQHIQHGGLFYIELINFAKCDTDCVFCLQFSLNARSILKPGKVLYHSVEFSCFTSSGLGKLFASIYHLRHRVLQFYYNLKMKPHALNMVTNTCCIWNGSSHTKLKTQDGYLPNQ